MTTPDSNRFPRRQPPTPDSSRQDGPSRPDPAGAEQAEVSEKTARRWTWRRATHLGAAAATVAAVIAFIAIAIRPEPAHDPTPPLTVTTKSPTAVTPTPRAVSDAQLAALPEATTFQTIVPAPPDTGSAAPSLLLYPRRLLPLYDAPGGTPIAKLPVTQVGNSPTAVPVAEEKAGWARVLLPSRPNGSSAWLPVDDAEIALAPSEHTVEVDLARRELTLITHRNAGRWSQELGRWSVDIGKPASPTPAARTFVLAQLAGGEGTPTPYSPVVLPLGAHSATLTSYAGGPGTVALHGWHGGAPRGEAITDGCIRVPPQALAALRELPLGTPVLIS